MFEVREKMTYQQLYAVTKAILETREKAAEPEAESRGIGPTQMLRKLTGGM